MNAWTNHVVSQRVRAEMGYVDDHFYVDHPEFIEQPWRLPSRCPEHESGGGGCQRWSPDHVHASVRSAVFALRIQLLGTGRYRGVGGILTGSMGALQGWGVIWRFAYSHNRDDLFQPGRLDYFNMVSDPLSQAAERASICLFLRGDMQPAPRSLTIAMTPQDLARPPARIPNLATAWHWAAWVTRVGTRVVDDPTASLPDDLVLPLGWATPERDYTHAQVAGVGDPYQLTSEKVLATLREREILRADNPTDPGKNIFQSETGEITIDGPRDVLTLDTPRTAGGFAAAGETIRTRHGVEAAVQDVPATVWVSTLDDQPITTSRRLLVTHLTDLQNTGIRYGERSRKTLLEWGKLPHLVRAGRAEVRLQIADPSQLHVWALSTSGCASSKFRPGWSTEHWHLRPTWPVPPTGARSCRTRSRRSSRVCFERILRRTRWLTRLHDGHFCGRLVLVRQLWGWRAPGWLQEKPIQGFERHPRTPPLRKGGSRSRIARSAWASSGTAFASSARPSASRITRTWKSRPSATCFPIVVPRWPKPAGAKRLTRHSKNW